VIQKHTYLVPTDKCGVFWVRVFHVYNGFNQKITYTGRFVKVSVRATKPNNWLRKKTKVKAFIIRTRKYFKKIDSSTILFFYNTGVLLKKRLTPRGKEIFGPILYNIKRKKFINSFSLRI
jgi:large subunit ribosomal protein L14